MKKRILGLLFWCAGALTLCWLCGCSTVGMAKLIRELKDDPATVSVSITHPYGNVRFVRTNPMTNQTVTVTPDGNVTVK